jgi:hypothetical protein
MRQSEQLQQPRRDLAHQEVLGRILAAVPAPRDDDQGRQAVHQRQRGQRVEARAQSRVLHQQRRALAGEPGPRGEPDRDVFLHGGDVRQSRMRLENRDQVLDHRAGDTGEEIVSLPLEEIGEPSAGNLHRT